MKKHTRTHTHTHAHTHYFCFFCVTCHHLICHRVVGASSVGSIRERAISAADVAGLVVVVAACIAHQSKSARRTRVAYEVGTVIKARITAAAQAELVQVVLLRALFFSEFEARNVLGLSCVGLNLNNNITGRFKVLFSSSTEASSSGNSNSSPVVGSRVRRSHFFVVRSLRSGNYCPAKYRKSISILCK
jgi:hypothetical protein